MFVGNASGGSRTADLAMLVCVKKTQRFHNPDPSSTTQNRTQMKMPQREKPRSSELQTEVTNLIAGTPPGASLLSISLKTAER